LIYSELVVFKLESPIPVPDIRISGIECVSLWNVHEAPGERLFHSPLAFAIERLGTETVFVDMWMELLDTMYPGNLTRHQQVAIVSYSCDEDWDVCVEDIKWLTDFSVQAIVQGTIESVLEKEFVEW